MVFRIDSSPYTHNQRQTSTIMLFVVLAMVPGILAQTYWFGCGNLLQMALAVITAWLTEAFVLYLRKKPLITTLSDHSALLSALLLGVSLPPLAPWWLVVIGTVFAILIAKQLFGGLGHNLFNPAMVGYVVLLISFPVQMTRWLPAQSLQAVSYGFFDAVQMIFSGHTVSGNDISTLQAGIDGVSQATPLDTFKTGLRAGKSAGQLLSLPVFQGALAGPGWQWVNLGFLIGGLFLLATRTIRWHLPLSFLLSLGLCSLLSQLLTPGQQVPLPVQLFSGATMLGTFFIITDPVTTAASSKGRLLYGALAGLLVWLIRRFGGYPDGVAFAVLLANITVPLIDYYCQPRVYGHRKE